MAFPNKIEGVNFKTTSPVDENYNCIAWAAATEVNRVIWPDDQDLLAWPPTIPRDESLNSFIAFFGLLGFSVCNSGEHVSGLEKIAIYMRDGKVKHACRQKSDGVWTSKLGPGVDADHLTPNVLADGSYGVIVQFMYRPDGPPPKLPDLYPPPAGPRLLSSSGLPFG